MSTPPLPALRRIFFDKLIVNARLGILEHELQGTQPIYIDAEFDVAVQQATDDSQITSVLDYRDLRQSIIDSCTAQHVNLLETLIEQTAQALMSQYPSLMRLHLRIRKPQAFEDCDAVGLALELCR